MRKKGMRRHGMIILTFFLFFTNVIAVYAAAVPDMSREGSITVTMRDPKSAEAVSGGTLTLYQVGSVEEDDGNYRFVLTEDFARSSETLEVLDADLAQRMADYAKKKNLAGITLTIGNDGTARFDGKVPGLYLLVQEKAAEGYYAVNPFLISIPMMVNDNYLYDVDAAPKLEVLKKLPEPPGDTPETGDHQNPAFWMMLLGIGILGLAGTLLADKRKRKE